MKFICDKSTLLKEISIAQEIISVKNALSILSNIWMEAKEGSLTIKATDLKIFFETQIPIHVEVPGQTTVFCDKFLGILRSLPEGEIEYELQDNNRFFIKPVGSKIEMQLKTIPTDKFPDIQENPDTPFFELPQSEVLEMIQQTIFSVSDDETRYFMNGVYLERKEEKLFAVATDGRRLSIIEKPLGNQVGDFHGIIIPPKTLNLIKKLASGQGNMFLGISDKSIYLHFDNQKIISNLIEGQFPNYSRVIPDFQEHKITVRRDELSEGLKRVSLLAEQKSKRIYLTAVDNTLIINTEESEIGVAKEIIPCEYNGPQNTLALNYSFLMDPLKVFSTDLVTLEYTDPKKAVTVATEPRREFFHIIMPMQID